MADDSTQNIPLLDPEAQRRYAAGLPPVLPSLSKPQTKPQQAAPTSLMPPVGAQNTPTSFASATPPTPAPPSMMPPAGGANLSAITPTALPPVKSLDPTPAQKAINDARSTLARDTARPSATESLLQKADKYHEAHPGFLGRLGQVGAGLLRGVDIAGETLAPGIAQNIPGSGLYKSAQEKRDQAKLTAAQTGAKTEAETAKDIAEGEKASAEAKEVGKVKPKEEKWTDQLSNGQVITNEKGQILQHEETSNQLRWSDLSNIKPPEKPEKPDTQTQNKEEYQRIVGNLAAMGYKTDPANLPKSVEAAWKAKKLNEADYKTASGFPAANQTPAGNIVVNVAEKQAAHQIGLEGSEVLVFNQDGTRTQMPYAEAQKRGIPDSQLRPLHSTEAQKNRDVRGSFTATADAVKNYRNDMKEMTPKLNSNDRDALKVLTEAEASGKVGGLLEGIFDEVPLVGPINAYASRLLNGTMRADQYQNMSKEGKRLVSDYFTAAVENLINMKAVSGSMARNPELIKLETHNIPLPYIDWDSANESFNRYKDRLNDRARTQVLVEGQ